MNNEKLIEMAKEAREFSRTEISNFKVGSALLTKGGKVFLGCNIEDPSGIGVTNICAERCAVVKALSEGYSDFERIAVVGGRNELVFCTPCGACRQFMNSFCPQIKVVCIDNNIIIEYSLKELLPYSFDEKFDNA